MGAIVKCRSCGKAFDADDATNVGTLWSAVYAAICPGCGAENRFAVDSGSLDVDGVISKLVNDKYAAKKQKRPIEERVRLDEVLEYWVQKYIAANYEQLGFKGLSGPSNSGPDFQVLYQGKWVHAEAEVVCDNYIQHKHHENQKWASCEVLIALSEKEPAPETKHLLPKTLIHIDKAHFTPWFRAAAREYAIASQQEEPVKKSFEKAALQLRALAIEIQRRFGFPSDENRGDDMWLCDELAFEFVERWMGSNEVKLGEIPPAAIDEFCRGRVTYVHERGVNLPVFYSRYCQKCDKTLFIRSRRIEDFADFENVVCPHCHTNLGEIRSDAGFDIVGEKKGNSGNSECQDPRTTQQFVGKYPGLH